MKTKLYFEEKKIERGVAMLVLAMLIFFAVYANVVIAAPQGASISGATTDNGSTRAADSHTAAGGSFTTMILNVTSQTSKWKAYLGNVTGRITLDNSNNMTIYDWALTNVQGEVYVTRNESVTFGSLACANDANITLEQNILGINGTSDDSINNTFRIRKHRSFTIGGTGLIANSTCYAIATYLNDSSQSSSESALFQEVLLSDSKSLVYVNLLENRRAGFDNSTHDFQLIVPDDPTQTTNGYYFYAELG